MLSGKPGGHSPPWVPSLESAVRYIIMRYPLLRKPLFLTLITAVCLWWPHPVGAGSPVRLRINTSHGLSNAIGAVNDAGLSAPEVPVTPSSPNNGTLHVYAYEPLKSQPPEAPPPAAFSTVNKIGGTTGGGIEFGVPAHYMHGKGQSTTASGVTAQLAGLLACVKYRHPTWNWFDVKAALRMTASNYPTGYDMHNYGYGAIDFVKATALANEAQLALFAPAAIILGQKGDRIFFKINPFRQSRRFTDVVFTFPKRPNPTQKELTLEEITAMGGRSLFSSYLYKDSSTYTYRAPGGETAYLVWFTQDVSLKFSRIESYAIFGPFTFPLLP